MNAAVGDCDLGANAVLQLRMSSGRQRDHVVDPTSNILVVGQPASGKSRGLRQLIERISSLPCAQA